MYDNTFHNAPEFNSESIGECRGRHHRRRDHGGHGRRRSGRGRGGRAARGDLRHVVLSLLDEGPMHGYQIITIINERTEGNWSPSPGAIYPTLSMLEDEGLITVSTQSGRKMARLTDEGAQVVVENGSGWADILEAYRNPESRDSEIYSVRTEFYKLRELIKSTPGGQEDKIFEILRKAADDIKRLQP